jgi:hypothetical protein
MECFTFLIAESVPLHHQDHSKVFDEELGRVLERTLLSSVHLRIADVSANSEAVFTAREVVPRVARRVLVISRDLIDDLLLFGWEHRIRLARVAEYSSLRCLDKFLNAVSDY